MEDKKIRLEISQELEEIIPEYLDSMSQETNVLRQLLLKSDFEQIARLGHRIKGHGGGYGFHFISECGTNIQQMAREQRRADLESWIRKLSEFLDGVDVIYVEAD